MPTRRSFFKSSAALLAAPRIFAWAPGKLNPDQLAKFVDPLPVPPVARNAGMRAGAPLYRFTMRQIETKLHRDLPATRMWSYDSTCPGPTIEARAGQGLWIEWANGLPVKHFLPVDHNLHGAEASQPEVRAVVHIHGARTPPDSDGYPEDWYVPGKSATYFYPNKQEAATLWYHDHAIGINRLNVYAGLFGLYIVRDEVEDSLNLPKGRYEIPLVVCDRFLLQDGQLDYPGSGDPAAPWIPEVFGNVMLVNGKVCPYLEVEPRRYRFRVVNAANGRFFRLSLSNGQEFHQIGTDQGLLASPVPLKYAYLAPGERADLVMDFSGHAGERIVLDNGPFEMMQFRVGNSGAAAPAVLPDNLLPAKLRPVQPLAESLAVKTRQLPIYEFMSPKGETMLMLLNGMRWHQPVTEKPVLNTVEIWSLINLTEDTHPIHLHLVRFQILDRRTFDEFEFTHTGNLRYTGEAVPAAPFEAGWKDTVRADPQVVTRIIVKFEGYVGRYVWHCHVLEHEDNDMMRPYEVMPA